MRCAILVSRAALIFAGTMPGCLSLANTESDSNPIDAGLDTGAYDSGIWPDGMSESAADGTGIGGAAGAAGSSGGTAGSAGDAACPSCGCVNFQTDNANCGDCGVSCARPHAVQSCQNGNCGGFFCVGLWLDCNNIKSDGCEVGGNTPENCGGCNAKCSADNVASAQCTNGKCTPNCLAGFANCNGPDPGTTDDGCEANLNDSITDCGACGTVCPPGEVCKLGVCKQ